MIAKEIIYNLHQRNIVIQSEGEELLLTGDTDALTEQDLVLLKENKAELLSLLAQSKDSELVFASKVTSDHYQAPVSNLQRNIYFLESLADGQSFYNVPTAFRLTGEIETAALEQAIASLCKQFHILRTVYQYQGDELKQIVEPFDTGKLPFTQVRVDAGKIGQRLKDEANYRFDLASEWPIRVVLFTSETEQVLSLNMHHIAIDGYFVYLKGVVECDCTRFAIVADGSDG